MFLKRKDCALPVSGHETTADYGRPAGPFFVPGFKDFFFEKCGQGWTLFDSRDQDDRKGN